MERVMAAQSSKRRRTQEMLDFQTKLKSLHEVSGELSQAASFDDFCRLAVELGRSRLGFDRLGLWFLDADPRFLVGSFGTDEKGQLRDERGRRCELKTDDMSAEMLATREGHTLRRNVPLLNDKAEVVGYGDVARGNLFDGQKILGWLNSDNLLRHEPWSDYQVELLGLYAASLGHLVTRQRIEQALRDKEESAHRFQEKLKALHEVTSELSGIQSFDDLCRRAVELGRSELGFDRLGLWFLEDDPEYMVGSFGIGEDGQIRDERDQRLPVGRGEYTRETLEGRVFVSSRDDVPLYNDHRRVVGTGWKAVAKMWDGDRNIGWVCTDSLLSSQPMSDNQLEILSLYADTLGHLAAVRKAEQALVAERNLFRIVIDALPDFVCVKDPESRFILVNRACWEDTPGATCESDLIGKTDFDILPRENAELYWAYERRVVQSGLPLINIEEPGRPEPGQSTTLLTTKVPLKDAHGQVVGLVSISRDITDRKRVEQQALELAVERERVKVLRESITSISHDLRTPLSIINSSLYLLERITDPENQKDKLATIKHQTALLEHLIEEIFVSARLENTLGIAQKPVNLSKLVAGVVKNFCLIAEKKSLAMVTTLQPNLPSILGDETQLERVLDNLLQNAITYTPDGGSIALKTFSQGGRVIVEVADTGIGISQDDLPYVFDHFFRVDRARSTGAGGMGLGLAIVKRIVEMHHGSVEVESTPGQGSVFRVLLPMLLGDQN
jgi:PAS domain S-box-containing protein